MTKIRLAHITTTDMSLDWLLGPQLSAFADAGYEVIGISAPGPHLPRLAERGITHVPITAFTRSANPLQDVRGFFQLVTALRRIRPDIVHTHNPKPGVLGRAAAWLTRVPLVVNTQHGLYAQPNDRRRRRWPVYAIERFAAVFGDVELVQNPEDVDTLVKRLRVPARKVHLLGNGIDLTRFDPATIPVDARTSRRREWGLRDDEVGVCVVGRLVNEKGLQEIVEAARLLRERSVAATVVMIGPDDPDKADALSPDVRAKASAAGVVLTGERTDIPECLAALDLFVTASWREGFPRAAMEAAAMGLATVATDIRGNRQVIDDGATGVLVPVRDPVALADAIQAICADGDRRSAMAAQARARAERDFGQAAVIEITLEAYRLLGDRRARRAS